MPTLECNYPKESGLPGCSSHQFMVTLRMEIADPSAVQAESDRLYGLFQTAGDTSLQRVGCLPEPAPRNGNGNGGSYSNGSDDWSITSTSHRFRIRSSIRGVTRCLREG